MKESDKEIPLPGSPRAAAEGCSCSVTFNRNGRGAAPNLSVPLTRWGDKLFAINPRCLLHGEANETDEDWGEPEEYPGAGPKHPSDYGRLVEGRDRDFGLDWE